MMDGNACELPNAITDEIVITGTLETPKPEEPKCIRSYSGGGATFDIEAILTNMDHKLDQLVQQMDRPQGLLPKQSKDYGRPPSNPVVRFAAPRVSVSAEGNESLSSAANSVVKDMVRHGSIMSQDGFIGVTPPSPDVAEKPPVLAPALTRVIDRDDSDEAEEIESLNSDTRNQGQKHTKTAASLGSVLRPNESRFIELWEFLEDPESGKHAQYFSTLTQIMIVVSVCVSLRSTSKRSGRSLRGLLQSGRWRY